MDFIVEDNVQLETQVDKEMRKVKNVVKKILEEDDFARSDDHWLLCKAMQHYLGVAIPYDKLKSMPSFESITRARRKLQEHGDYAPTEQVEDKRADRCEQFANWAVNN